MRHSNETLKPLTVADFEFALSLDCAFTFGILMQFFGTGAFSAQVKVQVSMDNVNFIDYPDSEITIDETGAIYERIGGWPYKYTKLVFSGMPTAGQMKLSRATVDAI